MLVRPVTGSVDFLPRRPVMMKAWLGPATLYRVITASARSTRSTTIPMTAITTGLMSGVPLALPTGRRCVRLYGFRTDVRLGGASAFDGADRDRGGREGALHPDLGAALDRDGALRGELHGLARESQQDLAVAVGRDRRDDGSRGADEVVAARRGRGLIPHQGLAELPGQPGRDDPGRGTGGDGQRCSDARGPEDDRTAETEHGEESGDDGQRQQAVEETVQHAAQSITEEAFEDPVEDQ